jgi:hypothetical protein
VRKKKGNVSVKSEPRHLIFETLSLTVGMPASHTRPGSGIL